MSTPGLIGAIMAGASSLTPPAGPQPTFGAIGPPRHAAAQASVLVEFPTGIVVSHYLLLGLLTHQENPVTITTVPEGFALIEELGTTGIVTSTGTDLNKIRLRMYEKRAVGGESGQLSFGFSGNGTFSTIMARFSNVNPDITTPGELFTQGLGQGGPLVMPGITTTLPRRLGVALAGFGNDEVINAFAGGTGPSWTLRGGAANSGGNDRAIAFLTCDLAAAGASTGHQDTTVRANNEWAIGAFALLPKPTGA